MASAIGPEDAEDLEIGVAVSLQLACSRLSSVGGAAAWILEIHHDRLGQSVPIQLMIAADESDLLLDGERQLAMALGLVIHEIIFDDALARLRCRL